MAGKITIDMIKELRAKTGMGFMDCKKALEEADGDMEKAYELLRERGAQIADKKASRVAREGLIEAYVHPGGKIGVIVEVNCETDFVARTDVFKQFVHDVALQIAAMAPEYVSKEDIPEEVLEKEKEIYRKQALSEGKPENIVERIVEGRLQKFYQEKVLLEQPFIKDEEKTIEEYRREIVAKVGENIVIRRFTRYVLGE